MKLMGSAGFLLNAESELKCVTRLEFTANNNN